MVYLLHLLGNKISNTKQIHESQASLGPRLNLSAPDHRHASEGNSLGPSPMGRLSQRLQVGEVANGKSKLVVWVGGLGF